VTALLAALARELFGWSLVGLRAITILAESPTAPQRWLRPCAAA
jgi:hypothetical protein